MTKFFNKFKKPVFGPFLVNFWRKNIFPENPAVTHNFIWVSSTMLKFRKKLIIKRRDRQKDERTDRRTYGRTTDPILKDPSSYCRGSNNTQYKTILCIGVSTPPSKTPPLFLAKPPPLVPSPIWKLSKLPLFRQSPQYIGFSWTPPPPPPPSSYLLKVTKCLVKISQFEFLFMTKQNILVYL